MKWVIDNLTDTKIYAYQPCKSPYPGLIYNDMVICCGCQKHPSINKSIYCRIDEFTIHCTRCNRWFCRDHHYLYHDEIDDRWEGLNDNKYLKYINKHGTREPNKKELNVSECDKCLAGMRKRRKTFKRITQSHEDRDKFIQRFTINIQINQFVSKRIKLKRKMREHEEKWRFVNAEITCRPITGIIYQELIELL